MKTAFYFMTQTPKPNIIFLVINLQQLHHKQESPADADKPARRESMPKIAPMRRENK